MLKIKDNIDLSELEKFGFRKYKEYNEIEYYYCDGGDNRTHLFVYRRKILTDICKYLVEKAELVRERDMEFLGQSAMLNLLAIQQKELKEYAEKLGVEL